MHVCCGRSHKFKTSKNKKDVKGKTEKPEEDEEVTTLEKKFEANKEMQKVQRAKNMDGQEYDITVENLLVSSTILVYWYSYFQDLKDTAKNQLKKTLTDLRKEELEKIDKKFEAKEEMKRVATAMTFHQEDTEHRKRSPLDNDCDQVYPNIFEISFACFLIQGWRESEQQSEEPTMQGSWGNEVWRTESAAS